MTFKEYIEMLSPGLTKIQKAMLDMTVSAKSASEALITYARKYGYGYNVIAARGTGKTTLQLKTLEWYIAPGRLKYLALHAKKKRVRKKNMRRIFKW